MGRKMHREFLLVMCLAILHALQIDGSANAAIVRGPYLSTVTQQSIIVSWTTAPPAPSMVEFGTTAAYGSLVSDSGYVMDHSFTLSGLGENTTYHYRVISGSDSSADYTFVTAVPFGEPFVFAVYGDTRSDHAAHVGVLSRMVLSAPRFVLNSGDLVSSDTVSNWDGYFADICKTTSVGATTAMYALPGNHENGQMFFNNLYLPHNNPDSTEAYYSFDYGNVHIICLNSEIDYGVESAQYNWLVSDLESSAAKAATFKIACWHRPPYSSNNHGSDLKVRNTLCPLMEANSVDIVFTGHDHAYERTNSINGTTYVVTGGGGAPLYDFTTSNSWTAYKEKAHHFCKVEVDWNSMRMYMIRSSDGTIADSLLITKGGGR